MNKTDLQTEFQVQKQWRLRKRFVGLRHFDHLMLNEFIDPEEERLIRLKKLKRIVEYSARYVPFYKHFFQTNHLDPTNFKRIEDLKYLPIIEREDLQTPEKFKSVRLPRGESFGGISQTSGSSGQPVKVLRSRYSLAAFTYLKQREYRWFRFNPKTIMASIRPADEITKQKDGSYYKKGMTLNEPYWPMLGGYFETGPFTAFIHTNPIEEQLEWLKKSGASYLLSQSANLEMLALAAQECEAKPKLKGMIAISQQLTQDMRELIETHIEAPVQQNFGLNEFGLVASRCPEAGRYHVHSEYYQIEIIDENGEACKPGETGRLLVTGLSDVVMPLFRYDTGDYATVAEGLCTCGRTSPTYSGMRGRYRRLSTLPKGTWEYWCSIQAVMSQMPRELAKPLRRYQLHQFKSGEFELRLQTRSKLNDQFILRVNERWNGVDENGETPKLNILIMDEIPRGPGLKLENFTSEFLPQAQNRMQTS